MSIQRIFGCFNFPLSILTMKRSPALRSKLTYCAFPVTQKETLSVKTERGNFALKLPRLWRKTCFDQLRLLKPHISFSWTLECFFCTEQGLGTVKTSPIFTDKGNNYSDQHFFQQTNGLVAVLTLTFKKGSSFFSFLFYIIIMGAMGKLVWSWACTAEVRTFSKTENVPTKLKYCFKMTWPQSTVRCVFEGKGLDACLCVRSVETSQPSPFKNRLHLCQWDRSQHQGFKTIVAWTRNKSASILWKWVFLASVHRWWNLSCHNTHVKT